MYSEEELGEISYVSVVAMCPPCVRHWYGNCFYLEQHQSIKGKVKTKGVRGRHSALKPQTYIFGDGATRCDAVRKITKQSEEMLSFVYTSSPNFP